jgi:hypothetical protein
VLEEQDDTVWIQERDLAKYLHMPHSAIARKRRAGKFAPYIKIGAQIVYRKAAVDAFLETQETNTVMND